MLFPMNESSSSSWYFYFRLWVYWPDHQQISAVGYFVGKIESCSRTACSNLRGGYCPPYCASCLRRAIVRPGHTSSGPSRTVRFSNTGSVLRPHDRDRVQERAALVKRAARRLIAPTRHNRNQTGDSIVCHPLQQTETLGTETPAYTGTRSGVPASPMRLNPVRSSRRHGHFSTTHYGQSTTALLQIADSLRLGIIGVKVN